MKKRVKFPSGKDTHLACDDSFAMKLQDWLSVFNHMRYTDCLWSREGYTLWPWSHFLSLLLPDPVRVGVFTSEQQSSDRKGRKYSVLLLAPLFSHPARCLGMFCFNCMSHLEKYQEGKAWKYYLSSLIPGLEILCLCRKHLILALPIVLWK